MDEGSPHFLQSVHVHSPGASNVFTGHSTIGSLPSGMRECPSRIPSSPLVL